MVIILILILILAFASVILIFVALLPVIIARIENTQKKKFDQAAKQLDTMFVDVKKEKLYPLLSLPPFILGIVGLIIFNSPWGALVGLAVGSILPAFIIKKMETMRKLKFHKQLLDCLMILANCLKSGLTLLQAFEVVVEEMPPPISQEFKLLLNENKLGINMETSLDRLSKRMGGEELNMMITAILVSRETGGDLSKIFDRVVGNIRQKSKIARQVETLTVQARWQGMILMALPIIFTFVVTQMNPDFFDIMLKSDTGRALLIYAVFSQVIGMLLIKRLSKVEV